MGKPRQILQNGWLVDADIATPAGWTSYFGYLLRLLGVSQRLANGCYQPPLPWMHFLNVQLLRHRFLSRAPRVVPFEPPLGVLLFLVFLTLLWRAR